jgi:hypothetical protein
MNQQQDNDLSMMQSTMLVLSNFSSTWSGNTAMANAVGAFEEHLDAVIAADQAQKTSTLGVRRQKRRPGIV